MKDPQTTIDGQNTVDSGEQPEAKIKKCRPAFLDAPRCQAKCKSTGERCKNPAVHGKRVCRLHGGKGGAKPGNKNAQKHGLRSAEFAAEKREARALLKLLEEEGKRRRREERETKRLERAKQRIAQVKALGLRVDEKSANAERQARRALAKVLRKALDASRMAGAEGAALEQALTNFDPSKA
ncbi:hypothetical protein JCM15519_01500 [Fundidesulfovibrio butyratiphilus]